MSKNPLLDEYKYSDGVPCDHPGCLHHISHPCEGCGRIGGQGYRQNDKRITDDEMKEVRLWVKNADIVNIETHEQCELLTRRIEQLFDYQHHKGKLSKRQGDEMEKLSKLVSDFEDEVYGDQLREWEG